MLQTRVHGMCLDPHCENSTAGNLQGHCRMSLQSFICKCAFSAFQWREWTRRWSRIFFATVGCWCEGQTGIGLKPSSTCRCWIIGLRLMKEIPVSVPRGQRTSELDVLAEFGSTNGVWKQNSMKGTFDPGLPIEKLVMLSMLSPLQARVNLSIFVNYAWNLNSTRMKKSLLHSLPLGTIFVDIHCLKKRLAGAVWSHKVTASSKQWIRLSNYMQLLESSDHLPRRLSSIIVSEGLWDWYCGSTLPSSRFIQASTWNVNCADFHLLL